MNCRTCGKPCRMEAHNFLVGDPSNPVERRTIMAPVYFKAGPDGRSVEAGFCSSSCATTFYLQATSL